MLFFNVEVGVVALMTTDWLSTKTLVASSLGMPNMHNVYLNASINLIAIHDATNSAPNVDDLIVFWTLEYHITGARLIKIMIPVWDCLVILFPAWSASVKQLICTG